MQIRYIVSDPVGIQEIFNSWENAQEYSLWLGNKSRIPAPIERTDGHKWDWSNKTWIAPESS